MSSVPRLTLVTRYVVTHKPKGTGTRTLSFARQGRETYETTAEAQEVLDLFNTPNGLARVLAEAELATLEVRPCPCYPSHFDPATCWFD